MSIHTQAAKQSTTNFWRPEIHQLASLEADLMRTEGYCNLCKKSRKGIFNKNPKNYQADAIKYAGKVVEDIRNYEMNAPTMDSLGSFYTIVIKPILDPLAKGLGEYRNKEGIEGLLKEFIGKYGKSSQDSSLVMQAAAVLKDSIYGTENLKEFLGGKGVEHLVKKLEGMDKEKIVKDLKDISKKIREDYKSGDIISGNMKCLVDACSQESGYNHRCDEPKTGIAKSIQELEKIKKERKIMSKDIASGVSWIFDVLASMGENLDNSEFEIAKKLASSYLKQL